jgi:hypothetical protein
MATDPPQRDDRATVTDRTDPASVLAPDRDDLPRIAGRYVLGSRLGRGGAAEVFRARDERLGRDVVLKLLRERDGNGARRMALEAQAAALFQHPGSVIVFDVGEHEGMPFIAMELVRGEPLATLVGDAAIPTARRIAWLADIARVLAAAHRAGLVHRDVKPSNVMIRDDGQVKLLDFGIARRHAEDGPDAAARLTSDGAFVGTPGYAAPEQVTGEPVDGRADQFGWGATAYEMLSGQRAFAGADVGAVLAKVLCESPPPLAERAPEVPAAVIAAVERALARAPAQRLASLDEAADLLEPFAERLPPRTPASTPTASESATHEGLQSTSSAASTERDVAPTAAPPSRGSRRAVALVVVALALALAASFVLADRERGDEPARMIAAASATPVASLGCSAASLRGEDDPQLARALGIGACARLAVELGVAWNEPGPSHPLQVEIDRSEATTRATLTLGERSASASATTPIQAIAAAATALAGQVETIPWAPAAIAAWGSGDEAGARRIARVFRRRDLRLSLDIAAESMRIRRTSP